MLRIQFEVPIGLRNLNLICVYLKLEMQHNKMI